MPLQAGCGSNSRLASKAERAGADSSTTMGTASSGKATQDSGGHSSFWAARKVEGDLSATGLLTAGEATHLATLLSSWDSKRPNACHDIHHNITALEGVHQARVLPLQPRVPVDLKRAGSGLGSLQWGAAQLHLTVT